ncbi:hypothetical protein FQR65_LT07753 [Abscondita terminalis]|nr:hypothetical protein FQR65_LT07753 [Abscondita terminalis]
MDNIDENLKSNWLQPGSLISVRTGGAGGAAAPPNEMRLDFFYLKFSFSYKFEIHFYEAVTDPESWENVLIGMFIESKIFWKEYGACSKSLAEETLGIVSECGFFVNKLDQKPYECKLLMSEQSEKRNRTNSVGQLDIYFKRKREEEQKIFNCSKKTSRSPQRKVEQKQDIPEMEDLKQLMQIISQDIKEIKKENKEIKQEIMENNKQLSEQLAIQAQEIKSLREEMHVIKADWECEKQKLMCTNQELQNKLENMEKNQELQDKRKNNIVISGTTKNRNKSYP